MAFEFEWSLGCSQNTQKRDDEAVRNQERLKDGKSEHLEAILRNKTWCRGKSEMMKWYLRNDKCVVEIKKSRALSFYLPQSAVHMIMRLLTRRNSQASRTTSGWKFFYKTELDST